MERYRTVDGYAPFIVVFKQLEQFEYQRTFIVYAREREDAERFAARNSITFPYCVTLPANITDDGFPLAKYTIPGYKGISTTVFVDHDGSMLPLADLACGAREFLRSLDDERRYENLRRELTERESRLA